MDDKEKKMKKKGNEAGENQQAVWVDPRRKEKRTE